MLQSPNQNHDVEERTLMAVARDLAMDLNPLEKILESHGIDPSWFEIYRDTPRFKAMLAEQIRMWEAADNVETRVKMKFLVATEMAMPAMFAAMHDPKEPLSARTELFKSFQKGAGILDRHMEAVADKVQITINLGAETKPVTLEAKVTPQVTGPDLVEIDA